MNVISLSHNFAIDETCELKRREDTMWTETSRKLNDRKKRVSVVNVCHGSCDDGGVCMLESVHVYIYIWD